MPGLVEGLVGVKAGEEREIRVSFPKQSSRSLPEELAGRAALFVVKCDEVRTRALPELNDAFADSVRPGLTYQDLYNEVRAAVGEEGDKRNTAARNDEIEKCLVGLVTCEIPESLIENQAKEKFATMMSEQRESGVSDEELKKMVTKEGFEKYKKVAAKGIERTMIASLVVDDLARREGLSADEIAVEDQVQLSRAQAEQAGQEFDEARMKETIEATLKREAVMDWLASKLTIEYTEVAAST